MPSHDHIIAITGPTASGKTRLAIELAESLSCEIISADSRQVYQEFSIGTARATEEECLRVKHHLSGHISVKSSYDAAQFAREAEVLIADAFQQKRPVIMAGGTGLYFRAALEGLHELPEIVPELRKQIIQLLETKGLEALVQEVIKRDPVFARTAELKNPRRMQRALELMMASGKSITELRSAPLNAKSYDIIWIYLEPSRDELRNRITERVKRMFAEGWVDEVRPWIHQTDLPAMRSVGYPEVAALISGKLSRAEAEAKIIHSTWSYARRQMTWFRNQTKAHLIEKPDTEAVLDLLKQWKARGK
jgi:tRNA dimethylallyltransferase